MTQTTENLGQISAPGDEGSVPGMIKMVSEIARSLVDSPEYVLVEAIPDDTGTILRLQVAASDIGKVIGRQGRTARSLRTILGAAGMKLKHRFSLDIVEQQVGSGAEVSG